MSQVDAAVPRRRFSVRAPITGLILIGLVVFASYWGWQRAFGEAVPEAVSTGCPTPTATTATSAPATSAVSAAGAAPFHLSVSGLTSLRLSGARLHDAASTTPAVTPTPTATTPAYLAAEDVVVNVYNATSRPGLAANTAAVLRDRGFDVGDVSNAAADDLVPEVAQIRGATAETPSVRLLVQHVPGAVVVPDGRSDDTVDLVLGDQFESLGDPTLVTPVPIPSSSC